ncbi:divalent-cation tolerance protein CutA [Solemya velum gill symbiont]|uniref:Divalent-cation tolerance protein CutA n=1 Tax=Solemya velum gill symbiont TaxID=2340 RepID=A0A0B0H857_SOVGS|nr:divalent-cation tolerance protein CutA [Solemya velum gill symbiont]KHF26338.1 hypothetical protein JV46_16370 [Solemya velum gill symbiont]OOY51085.1 divalent-cation tolerance protein CutA [Solemya velum gill symbiont]OOY56220.1 divalent-cation tolerance protein CutA [Solemya velum gill symbiont]OOY56558.1 divalent-cation tolerance protein CutA [Solemya velum gill symbiont]OOY59604.1 divalent-cation tolerance protein CutA [Solemya velum gill symbiont]
MKLIVYCTCPDKGVAETIAEMLVERRLAACVNILPQVQSIYRWQGQIEHDDEILLLIKSDVAHFESLREAIMAQHPYDLPEIIGVPVAAGHPEYLTWITNELTKS